jgi:hypothetical protein
MKAVGKIARQATVNGNQLSPLMTRGTRKPPKTSVAEYARPRETIAEVKPIIHQTLP